MLSRFLLHKTTTHICPPLRYDLSYVYDTSTSIRIFFNPQLFLSRFKNFHVHTYPTRIRIHSGTKNSSGNTGNRACVVKRAKFASCSAFHGEELGLILLRHRMKKYPHLSSTRPRINSVFKKYTFHSGERIQKVADLYAGFTG